MKSGSRRVSSSAYGILLATTFSMPLFGHGGGLNAEGCHNDRKNGGYHCHRAPVTAPQPALPLLNDASPSQGAYHNCAAARAAGAAPLRYGDPGYGPHLDRDRDGIGCE